MMPGSLMQRKLEPTPFDEDYKELAIDTLPMNILFFLKRGNDESILESMFNCISYLLEKQEEAQARLVHTIFSEKWVLEMLPQVMMQQGYTKFQSWNGFDEGRVTI